jgi:outer membrane biosynthesis protein TonB
MSIDINVNVHFSADSNLLNAVSDFAGCLAVISAAGAGNTTARLPEKTVEVPTEKPAAAPKKAEPKKEKLEGKPVSKAKEKEINDLVDAPDPEPVKKESPAPAEPTPAPVKEEPKTTDDEAAKREKLKELFTKAAVEGKAAQCKALLAELDVKRQSQIPTDILDEALAKVEAL